MFSVRYQMALQDLYGLRSAGDMSNYYITQSYISLLADFLIQKNKLDLVELQIDCILIWTGQKQ